MVIYKASEREQAIEEVLAFMQKHKLTIADLIECCGSQLKSPNRRIADRARRIDRCWDLMARTGVRYANLEDNS